MNALLLETLAVVLALAYLLLAIREQQWCWPAAIVSSILYFKLLYDAALYMESALQLFYVAVAVYGWWAWQPGGAGGGPPLRIHRRPLRWHLHAVTLVLLLSLASGWLLHRYTPAAWPYLDSFTAWGSILATGMVARKLLENWLYWFVIDSISLVLYLNRELYLTAGLFALYLVLIVVGWRTWNAAWRSR